MNRVYKFWKMEGEQMDVRLCYNLVKALIFPRQLLEWSHSVEEQSFYKKILFYLEF